jgi:hypothetical protein
VVRLQPYATAAPLPPGRFLVFIFVRDWVDPRAIVLLEWLNQLKKIQWPHRESNPRPSSLYGRTKKVGEKLSHWSSLQCLYSLNFENEGLSLSVT